MKVAFFYNLKFGGAKRVVMDQVQYFRSEKVETTIYTINHEKDIFDPGKYAKVKNFKIALGNVEIPVVGKLFFIYFLFWKLKKTQQKIAQIIDSKKYDIVIVHPDQFTQAPYLLRYLKTKSIYYTQEPYRLAYEHSMRIEDRFPFYIKLFEHSIRYIVKVVDRTNVKSATWITASSLSVRERMIQGYNVFPSICPPGINTKVFRNKNLKRDNILFVGSETDPIDGYDLLVESLELIPKSKRPLVKKVIWRNENNERITEEELSDLYNSSKLTVCMSRFETFGLIPLESMGCGTPVVATNIGGHRETVVNDVTGFLVDPDPKEIANKITYLLTTKKYSYYSTKAQEHISRNWNLQKRNEYFLKKIRNLISI